MITINEIIKTYKLPIKRQFRVYIESYINNADVQEYLKKAMSYNLTKNDCNTLFVLGNRRNGKYPHLYWLCCIYIHPLTIAQNLVIEINKL